MAAEIVLHGNFTRQTSELIAAEDIESVDRAQFILHNMGFEDSKHFELAGENMISPWAVASLYNKAWGLLIVLRDQAPDNSYAPEWFMLYVQVGKSWKKYRVSNSLVEIAQIAIYLMSEGAKDKHGKRIDDVTVDMVKWHWQFYEQD